MVLFATIALVAEGLFVARLRGELRSRSLALLESLSFTCAADVASGAVERLDDTLTELAVKGRAHLDVRSVALLEADGHALAHSGSGSFEATVAEAAGVAPPLVAAFSIQALASSGPLWRDLERPGLTPALALSMPVLGDRRWGTLVAVFDTGAVATRIHETRVVLVSVALSVALTLVLTLHGGLLVLVVRPLGRLRAAVRRLQAGDLSARSPAGPDHELGQLSAAFNAMAAELEACTRTLEARVAERTAEAERRQEDLETLNAQLAVLARTDGLTGLVNRRHLFELLGAEIPRAARHGHRLAIAMLDVDHFKRVNDTWGHDAGDAVLQTVAQVLKRELRAHDIVSRYGGEEFVVVLVEVDAARAPDILERLRREVEAAVTELPPRPDHPGEAPRTIGVTVSAGWVVFPDDPGDVDGLLGSADEALYRAKHGGRNRIVHAASVPGPRATGSPFTREADLS